MRTMMFLAQLKRGLFLLSLMIINPIHAANELSFRKDSLSATHWFTYLLVFGILLFLLLGLAKKSKTRVKNNSRGQIIERIAVHHKMQVYVMEYESQRFLIAENQNALAIHSLPEGKSLV